MKTKIKIKTSVCVCFAPTQIPGGDWANEDMVGSEKKERKKEKNDTLSNKQHTWVEKRKKTVTLISTKIIYGRLVSTLFLG